MAGGTALERFLEARRANGGRASELAGLVRCHELSDALDATLSELASAIPPDGLAVVAVGGYGRHEQCRHSDVDVMLLVDGGAHADAVPALLHPLWDAGLKVGHSVRSVGQAGQAAGQSVQTLTALLSARLVCGDRELYGRFISARRGLAGRHRRWLRGELVRQHRELVQRERWQLQEPDVKSGRGGLRQLQALRWLDLADAIAGAASSGEPEGTPLPAALEAANETLLATRNALHALEDRPNDRFRQDLAGAVAGWLRVDRTGWSRGLFAAMRTVDASVAERLGERDGDDGARRRWFMRLRPRKHPAEGSSDLQRLLAVLRREDPAGLDPLPATDWLTRILPEWDQLRCLPHVTPFHRHPVDVHVLRTVNEVRHAIREDEEATGTPAAAAELHDEDEVLLAALMHDIGKGHEGDHSQVGAVIAERFAARVGLDADTARRLSTVAAQHLLLPTVATRRDIADDRVIGETAELAGDAHTLRLLYLVSVADARASGPDVWNPWKAQLIRSLYLRVLDVLSEGAPEAATAARLRTEAAVAALAGQFPPEEVEAHLNRLPPGYVLSTPHEVIGEQLALIREAGGGTAIRRDRLDGLDRLTVVTPDRPGILSLVAGTLAAHNANVLGGVAYTRDDAVAIDVMHVDDALGHGIDERRWRLILDAVPRALSGEFPVDERLAETRATYQAVPRVRIPTTVHIDNADSERYSIVEIHTADRLGLLYVLTRTLHELSLDIHLAKVDTIGAEVVDAFYVLRENGRRVDEPDEIERVQRRIEEAVAALDEAPA